MGFMLQQQTRLTPVMSIEELEDINGKIHATGLIGSVWSQKSETNIVQEISHVAPPTVRLHCVTGSRAPLDWDQGFPLLCCLDQPCAGFYKLVEKIKGGFLGIKGHI